MNGEELSDNGPSLQGMIIGNQPVEPYSRTKLRPREWLKYTRILCIDGLLKRRRLNPGVARLLVMGLQITTGLKCPRVERAYVEHVRSLVSRTHRYYREVAQGNFIPLGINHFGKSLDHRVLTQMIKSPNLSKEVRIKPDGAFRRLLRSRFPTNLGVFLRLNDASLGKVFAAVRFGRIG